MTDDLAASQEADALRFRSNEAIKAADRLALAKDQLARAQQAVAEAEAGAEAFGGAVPPAVKPVGTVVKGGK